MFRLLSQILPERALQNLTGAYFNAQHWLTIGRQNFHSNPSTFDYPNMKVQIHAALSDNYMYLIIDEKSGEAAIVDPVKPAVVIDAIKEANVNLTTVLTTHHHWDHAGGNDELVKQMGDSSLKVFGGDDRIGSLTNKVKDGDTFTVGGLTINCIATPCHTTGHICYYVTSTQPDDSHKPVVFTGDTLFLGGCGKFFEGTPEQMHTALVKKLGILPDDTDVYCGHEYAVSNLKFGLYVDPANADCQKKLADIVKRRELKIPSVPSTIGEEKLYNPFMRVEDSGMQTLRGTSDGVDTMRSLREEKDNWKPE